MSTRGMETRLILAIDSNADRVRGWLSGPDHVKREFAGHLELMSLIEAIRSEAGRQKQHSIQRGSSDEKQANH